jgi:hypothetical protein
VMLRTLPALSEHPFAQAVVELPDFNPQRLEELEAYLKAAVPSKRLRLTRAQGLLLYQAAQVTLVLFLQDILDEGGLDDLLQARLQGEDEALTAELMSKLRQVAAIILGTYLELVSGSEAAADDFRARRQRLDTLMELALSR